MVNQNTKPTRKKRLSKSNKQKLAKKLESSVANISKKGIFFLKGVFKKWLSISVAPFTISRKTFGPKRIILIKEIGDHKENRPPIPSGISKFSSELKPCWIAISFSLVIHIKFFLIILCLFFSFLSKLIINLVLTKVSWVLKLLDEIKNRVFSISIWDIILLSNS